MNVNEYKLNRSLSESDLTNQTLDNSKIDFSNNQRTPRVIRTAMYMEEIVDSRSSHPVRRYSSFKEIRDNKSSTYFYESCQTDGSVIARALYKQHQPNSNDTLGKYHPKIEPMDIDYNCDDRSMNNYDETFNVDQAQCQKDYYNKKRRYEALDSVLKQQKYANLKKGKGQSLSLCDTKNFGTNPIFKDVDNCELINTNSKLTKVKAEKSIVSLKFIFPILALVASVFYTLYGGESICTDTQLTNISYSLIDRIHGQKQVVETVIRNLKHKENWEDRMKVLVFLGPPGVGKTFLANIIKENLKQQQVSELYGKELLYKIRWEQIAKAVDDNVLNLIVVDDIVKEDAIELMAFAQALPRHVYIIVISIFNFNNSNDLDEIYNPEDVKIISKSFEHSNLDYELIIFDEFNDQQVKDWLIKQMILRNISESLHDFIADAVLQGHETKRYGLKGLTARLLYQIERLNH